MPLDHIGLGQVADLQASKVFYEKALKPLGYEVRVRANPIQWVYLPTHSRTNLVWCSIL